MTQVSKIAAELWENASEDEKAFWQRQYEINRDFKNETTDEVEIFGTDFSPLPTNNYQMNDLSFPAELVQFENDFLFCNFCQNLLDANVEFCPCLKTLYDTNEFSCYPTCNELPNYHLPNGEIFNIQDSYITEFPNNINFNLFNT
ncbi:9919_t:CDS:1 [Funneliformis geosporum]|uniref:9919_t:CDS:1 n=1 Tax=Funneliformis geosporum TaxID=1117311 RepID=A0A9W4SUS6_9GLOM|nr:9919_t:CDS:1 [Funneliformis geosporum]